MEDGMSFFKSGVALATEEPPMELRDTLFGDLPIDQWTGHGAASEAFPWSAFLLARAHIRAGERKSAIRKWREVLDRPGLEPRHYLQAWHFLRKNGENPPPEIAKKVFGVVIEVGMEDGLDLLAAYPDHSARYYNFSGRGVVWEHPDDSLDAKIDALLSASAEVASQIGRWDKPRPPAPVKDMVRLCFLTPSGLHFGQAGLEVMSRDPIGGKVLYLAGELMQGLMAASV
jgi:hypothetical protein